MKEFPPQSNQPFPRESRLKDSEQYLRSLLIKDDTNPYLHYQLAEQCRVNHRPRLAIFHYESALDLNLPAPASTEARICLGFIYLTLGHREKAEEVLLQIQ